MLQLPLQDQENHRIHIVLVSRFLQYQMFAYLCQKWPLEKKIQPYRLVLPLLPQNCNLLQWTGFRGHT